MAMVLRPDDSMILYNAACVFCAMNNVSDALNGDQESVGVGLSRCDLDPARSRPRNASRRPGVRATLSRTTGVKAVCPLLATLKKLIHTNCITTWHPFSVRKLFITLLLALLVLAPVNAQRYTGPDGRLRVALVKQPFSPTGISVGPNTMANGGIQQTLKEMNAVVRVEEAILTADEALEYGGWKKLGMALGHFADIVQKNERDGYFTVGLLATCPSMPGLVAGLQHSGPTRAPIKIGMLWLDAHPDFNTPETTRSGSLGGMPVAVATGRALQRMRLDAHLDPPLADRHIVMGGVRLQIHSNKVFLINQ